MNASDAWLLECGEALSIAVSDRQMVELLQAEHCHHVPGAPYYCSRVLLRNDNLIPVMDIEALCQIEGEGVIGAITGRAIYEGKLDFSAALKLAQSSGQLSGNV